MRTIDVPVDDLDTQLDGLRIVQISDLHVGLTIRSGYVRRVRLANALSPDTHRRPADGSVARLAPHGHRSPSLSLPAAFFVPGNHEYYSGAKAWMAHSARSACACCSTNR